MERPSYVEWQGERDALHRVEPFAHLSARFVEPMRGMLGRGAIDEPAQDASEVATTVLHLDDSSVENGCTGVVPVGLRLLADEVAAARARRGRS